MRHRRKVNIAKCMETVTTKQENVSLKKKLSPFCVSAKTWIAKDMSNLAWQILDTKTKILSLFAESLLWQSKGNLNRAYSVIAAALGCDDATLKAPLWWFTLPSQRCFHSGPLMEAYMMLRERQQREDNFFFKWKWFILHIRVQQEQTGGQTLDAPRVERRLCWASFTSRRLGVWFKGGEPVLLVRVSPSLSDRVISLWNTTSQFNSSSSHWLTNYFICVISKVYLLKFSTLPKKKKIDSYFFGSQTLEWGHITYDQITDRRAKGRLAVSEKPLFSCCCHWPC